MLSVSLLFACANLPSVCDTMTGKSYLCDISKKYGVRLEDVGNGLIIINAVAISQGLYTKDQAKSVLEEIRALLENPITYSLFKAKVILKVDTYPGLLEVASVYFSELGMVDKTIYAADRDLLIAWIDKQLGLL